MCINERLSEFILGVKYWFNMGKVYCIKVMNVGSIFVFFLK